MKSLLRYLAHVGQILLAIAAGQWFFARRTWQRQVIVGDNERIFRSLVNNLPGIVFALDEHGVILLVGGSGLKAIGVDAARFIGRHVSDLYHNFPNILEDFQRALAGETLLSSIEMVGLTFDVWYSPLRDEADGKICGVIGIATDVTERRRAEDLLQYQASLLHSVSDAIIAIDMSFRVQNWNEAAEQLYGWQMDEACGRQLQDLIVTEKPHAWENELMRQTTEHGFWKGEVRQRRKDGAEIVALISASILIDNDGNSMGLVILSRDITELKRAEEQALELAVERERIRMLRDFIGDASHDFRTPLSAIHTSVYLLKKKQPELAQQPHLDVIESQTKQLSRLVDDLLTLSRLDSTTDFEFKRADITAFTRDVVVALRPLAETRNHNLILETTSVPIFAYIDAQELRRAVSGIIVNAINYTPRGGMISVSTEANSERVAIRIKDSGIGIASEDLPRIFDRFYRVDKARAVETGGTGLGLAIASKIVSVHRGEITVESSPGNGSVFTIWLPLAERAG